MGSALRAIYSVPGAHDRTGHRGVRLLGAASSGTDEVTEGDVIAYLLCARHLSEAFLSEPLRVR